MDGPILMLAMVMVVPLFLVFWNKRRIKGKVLGFFARKDKSIVWDLCELRDAFVIWGNRAYDLYPGRIRVAKFPAGWPSFLQEIVPAILYDEDDAIPMDWVALKSPGDMNNSMELRSALDQNWIRKWVEETAKTGETSLGFNWRKVFPIILMVVGGIGLIVIMSLN